MFEKLKIDRFVTYEYEERSIERHDDSKGFKKRKDGKKEKQALSSAISNQGLNSVDGNWKK